MVNPVALAASITRAMRAAKPRPLPKARMVTIRTPRGFVPRVDPITRQATGDRQQFRAVADERGHKLVIVPKSEWVAEPLVMDVDTVSYR